MDARQAGRLMGQDAGPSTRSDAYGSRTMTLSGSGEQHNDPVGVLHLRGSVNTSPDPESHRVPSRRVAWTEDMVDNEGMGKKKSKSEYYLTVCCIFHKQRAFDESSSESSDASDPESGSEPDSDSSTDNGKARPSNHKRHHHKDCSHKRRHRANAYERS